ncbi:hypothetical protein [Thermomonospora amylolytica]|uniref:hypothetical protein n=1 Tax=Thermomonospora amylolytica TaxID=1411117 RepID=UPI0013008347|nr:hypothetical protein [Thermomonospora amylolytica]
MSPKSNKRENREVVRREYEEHAKAVKAAQSGAAGDAARKAAEDALKRKGK